MDTKLHQHPPRTAAPHQPRRAKIQFTSSSWRTIRNPQDVPNHNVSPSKGVGPKPQEAENKRKRPTNSASSPKPSTEGAQDVRSRSSISSSSSNRNHKTSQALCILCMLLVVALFLLPREKQSGSRVLACGSMTSGKPYHTFNPPKKARRRRKGSKKKENRDQHDPERTKGTIEDPRQQCKDDIRTRKQESTTRK